MKTIIGTHDSAAYKLDLSVNFWKKTSKWGLINWLGSLCSSVRNRIKDMTLTQSLSIYEQLEHGARALDLRVAYKKGTFYVAHTFCCGTLENALREIRQYSIEHPTEVIYVLIKPDWVNRYSVKPHEKELIHLLESILSVGALKCYYQPFNGNVLNDSMIRHLSHFQFRWLNANSVDEFIRKFDDVYFTKTSLLSFALTPKIDNFWDVFSVSLKEYADALNPHMYELLGNKPPTIAVVDFFDRKLIVKK